MTRSRIAFASCSGNGGGETGGDGGSGDGGGGEGGGGEGGAGGAGGGGSGARPGAKGGRPGGGGEGGGGEGGGSGSMLMLVTSAHPQLTSNDSSPEAMAQHVVPEQAFVWSCVLTSDQLPPSSSRASTPMLPADWYVFWKTCTHPTSVGASNSIESQMAPASSATPLYDFDGICGLPVKPYLGPLFRSHMVLMKSEPDGLEQ